jgi:hypothetical protein
VAKNVVAGPSRIASQDVMGSFSLNTNSACMANCACHTPNIMETDKTTITAARLIWRFSA